MHQVFPKTYVVFFAAISVLAVWLVVFSHKKSPNEELDELAAEFRQVPAEANLRELLNHPADGAFGYYQMALVGAAFAQEPEIFRAVSADLHTEKELKWFRKLAAKGRGIFEYYPELKPENFETIVEQHTLHLGSATQSKIKPDAVIAHLSIAPALPKVVLRR